MTIVDGTGSIKVIWYGSISGIGTSNILAHGILNVEGSPQPSLQVTADSLAVSPV